MSLEGARTPFILPNGSLEFGCQLRQSDRTFLESLNVKLILFLKTRGMIKAAVRGYSLWVWKC